MGEGRREVVDLNKTECLVVSVYIRCRMLLRAMSDASTDNVWCTETHGTVRCVTVDV